jgi:dTDP-4-dehydrorhamnose 3,5-epimerase-like enzyme
VSLADCKLVDLPVVENPQGNLVFAEGETHIPFPIARVFYVYDVPAEAVRGGHAHHTLEEVVFCVSGRLEMEVDDGAGRQTFVLDNPRRGLHLSPLVWFDIRGFDPGSIYVVFASALYDEDDYIRDYDRFIDVVGSPPSGADG